MVRLIQLLSAISEGLTYDEIVDFLHTSFKYPIGLINIAFQTALEYALIRAINFRVNDIDREFARPKKHLLFATTPKGKYILRLAFEDYAVFYFMAVASRIIAVIASSSMISDIHLETPRFNNSNQWAIWTVPGLKTQHQEQIESFRQMIMVDSY